MKHRPEHIEAPSPVEGASYSLFGGEASTDGYYHAVDALLMRALQRQPDERALLAKLRRAGRRGPGGAKRALGTDLVMAMDETLGRFTRAADSYLAHLPLLPWRERGLAMPRRTYHVTMLEIALVNRMHRARFARSSYRIALLPHCLRDLSRECRAEPGGIDLRCRKCSENCFVRHVSDMLERYDVVPYIWMNLRRRLLSRTLRSRAADPAVLGIACIPELREGMRFCMHVRLPVVGLPLNGNRCDRWLGSLHDNSVSLRALEELLDGTTQE